MSINTTTVIFDFGYVLSLPPRASDYQNLATLAGIDGKAFEEVYWGQRADYDRGTIDGPAYWRRVAQAAGVEITPAQIGSLIAADIEIWMRANPVMMEWVRALKNHGLKIAVLSNMPIEISTHMRRFAPWFRDFDYVCFSAEVQLAKPEHAIFHACLKVVGSKPEECLFIDDRADNVEAAQAVGMHAVGFVSVEGLAVEILPFDLPALEPAQETKMTPRPLGLYCGEFNVPDDFDAPLPDEIQALFEGEKPKRDKPLGKGKKRPPKA
ncbi:MAG: HAD family phosphatase [Terriglobia bacterium]|jgi:putative hydrolase of the HAD superfamily